MKVNFLVIGFSGGGWGWSAAIPAVQKTTPAIASREGTNLLVFMMAWAELFISSFLSFFFSVSFFFYKRGVRERVHNRSRLATRRDPLVLRHYKPSIHIDRLPGDIGGIVRSKKGHQSRNIFGVTPTFKGNSFNPFFHQLAGFIVAKKLPPMFVIVGPHVGRYNTRADSVHRDAVGCQFLCQALGKADHREFACRIMRGVDEAL